MSNKSRSGKSKGKENKEARTATNSRNNDSKPSVNEVRDLKERNKGGRKVMDDRGRDNNPNWYFLDASLAESATQLAFQQLAGYSIDTRLDYSGITQSIPVPNIVRYFLNPSPGVQTAGGYPTSTEQNSAINLAGFRLFSKLSA